MTDRTSVSLKSAPTERQIRFARVAIKAATKLGREHDPRIVAIAEWPIEEAADYSQP